MRRFGSSWLFLLPLLGLLGPGDASALGGGPITITFDGGTYDPNPPPGLEGTPSIYEDGALYEGFWFVNAGTPGATYGIGHTHIEWNVRALSLVDGPHSWRNDMMGAHISILDGSAFRVVSIDYRLRSRLPTDGTDPNSQMARLPWSTPWQDVHLLLSSDPDPATANFPSFESQWTQFDIDDGSQLDLGGGVYDPKYPAGTTPWRTLAITGFDNVTDIFIGHTGANVLIDNIVLERVDDGGGATPEPGSGLLLGLGLGLLAGRRRARH